MEVRCSSGKCGTAPQPARVRPQCKTCQGSWLTGYDRNSRKTIDLLFPTSWDQLAFLEKNPIACGGCANNLGPDAEDDFGPYKICFGEFLVTCGGCRGPATRLQNIITPTLAPPGGTRASCCWCQQSSKPLISWGCAHQVCLGDCFNAYFDHAKRSLTPHPTKGFLTLRCPFNCPDRYLEADMFNSLAPPQLQTYQQTVNDHYPKIISKGGWFCPLPGCFEVSPPPKGNRHLKQIRCKSCNDWYCKNCKQRTQICSCILPDIPQRYFEEDNSDLAKRAYPVKWQQAPPPPAPPTGSKSMESYASTPVGHIRNNLARYFRVPNAALLLTLAGGPLEPTDTIGEIVHANSTTELGVLFVEIPGGPILRASASQEVGKKCPNCPTYLLHEKFSQGCHTVKCPSCPCAFCYWCGTVGGCACPPHCNNFCPCPTKERILGCNALLREAQARQNAILPGPWEPNPFVRGPM